MHRADAHPLSFGICRTKPGAPSAADPVPAAGSPALQPEPDGRAAFAQHGGEWGRGTQVLPEHTHPPSGAPSPAVPHSLQFPIPCNSPSPATPHSHQCPPPRHPTSHPMEHPGELSIPRGIPSPQPWPRGCLSPALTVSSHLHCLQELRTQKQKMVSERERLQAELDHLRKCLALPAMQWSRGYFKGYPR